VSIAVGRLTNEVQRRAKRVRCNAGLGPPRPSPASRRPDYDPLRGSGSVIPRWSARRACEVGLRRAAVLVAGMAGCGTGTPGFDRSPFDSHAERDALCCAIEGPAVLDSLLVPPADRDALTGRSCAQGRSVRLGPDETRNRWMTAFECATSTAIRSRGSPGRVFCVKDLDDRNLKPWWPNE